ncbi:MAG: DNA-packaging protein [Desulfotalea sp.]|nr:MAG: DNA-packaging protein [Desulfotalea sp.]
MGAPKGNQFWKQRSKHGRDKIFSSPEILWEEACKYFEWIDENPLQESKIFNGRDGIDKDTIDIMRAYTWDGLELFLGIDSLREYKTNPDYKDFSQVITRVGKIIYNQKFEGAAAGLLNANIIARDLGLTDKTDNKNENTNTHSGDVVINFTKKG